MNRAPDVAAELADHERAIDAELCKRRFAWFVARFFELVAGRPFESNHATSAIIAVLQAVADGRLVRVLIAKPPGLALSTLLALYAAWRRARDPAWRSIHGGHASDLATNESRKVRRLIEHEAFRAMFPRVALRADENTAAMWSTTLGGVYFAIGLDSAVTGKRARELVLDDPMNVSDRFSKAVRDDVYTTFVEALSPRLDGDRAPQIVAAQRSDRDDLIGRLIEAGGWTLVELAAEFDTTRRCVVLADDGSEVWRDPRTEDGELLAENVQPRAKLEALKVQMGALAYACQFNQRPADDSGATIKRAWWRFHRPVHVAEHTPRPAGCDTDVPAILTPEHFTRIVVAADLTFGAMGKKADFVSIQAWGALAAARFLLRRWKRRAGLLESVAMIKEFRTEFPTCKIIIEKAASGAGAIEELAAAGVHGVVAVKPIGSKRERIGMVEATIEAGNCFLPLGLPGLADFVEELAGASSHDDEQDCAAYAIHELNVSGVIAVCPQGGSWGTADRDEPSDVAPLTWVPTRGLM